MAMLLLIYVALREAMVVTDRQRWWYMPGMMVVAATVCQDRWHFPGMIIVGVVKFMVDHNWWYYMVVGG